MGKDEQRLTLVKLAGVDGAIGPLGSAAKPLRNLAVLVRDRVR